MQRILHYNTAIAVIKYGVNVHPLTQMLMLGFNVERYHKVEGFPEYTFVVSNDVQETPEYLTVPPAFVGTAKMKWAS